jgi:hypothetical protein
VRGIVQSNRQEKAYSGILQVQRNRPNIHPGEDAWGFGQIISLILLFGSVIDVAVAIHKQHTMQGIPPEEEVGSENEVTV